MPARLMLGDCLDVMAGLPGGMATAIVTDPPYGQSNESYDRGVDPAVWRECFRVAAPVSCLISFAGSPTYHRIASDIEAAGWQVRQMWGWVYRDGFITSAWPKEGFDRLAPAFDPICFATKGRHLLNLEREGVAAWTRDEGSRGDPGYSGRSSNHGLAKAVGRWPKSVVASEGIEGFQYFALSRTNGGSTARLGHPNTKPLSLMEWIVGKTAPGGTVVDPFAGSCTTGVACINTGRSFVGIERDATYFAIGDARLTEAEAPLPLLAERA